jgi:predicted nucleic acid-binding protein
MKKVFFDSSAYTKNFTDEEGSNKAKEIIRLAENTYKIKIFLSSWVINESIAAVDQKCYQRREIDSSECETTIATILKHVMKCTSGKSNIAIIMIDSYIVDESIDLIRSLHISADDSLQVQAAYNQKCDYFICQDNGLKLKVDNKNNLRVLDIANETEMNNFLRQF